MQNTKHSTPSGIAYPGERVKALAKVVDDLTKLLPAVRKLAREVAVTVLTVSALISASATPTIEAYSKIVA
jgi:hypothetical protein